MTSSSVVATAPLRRISAAAPSMIRLRVAAPFGVSFLASDPTVTAELLDSWVQTVPGSFRCAVFGAGHRVNTSSKFCYVTAYDFALLLLRVVLGLTMASH